MREIDRVDPGEVYREFEEDLWEEVDTGLGFPARFSKLLKEHEGAIMIGLVVGNLALVGGIAGVNYVRQQIEIKIEEEHEAGRQEGVDEMQLEIESALAEKQAVREALQLTLDDLVAAEQKVEVLREYAPASDQEREAVIDQFYRFAMTNSDEPITEKLLADLVFGPTWNLVTTTFGHIDGLSEEVSFEFHTREELEDIVTDSDNVCGVGRFNPDTLNGWASRPTSLALSTVNLTDSFSIRDNPEDDPRIVQAEQVGEYWYIVAHEELHGVTPLSYRYYPKSGEGFVRFQGLKIIDDTSDTDCAVIVWNRLNEAAIDWLVGEMYMTDDETFFSELSSWRDPVQVARVEALAYLVQEVVGMSRMEFAQLYFASQPLLVEAEFDRRISARQREVGLIEHSEIVTIARDALNAISSGDLEEFYRLMEVELGLSRPDRSAESGAGDEVRSGVAQGGFVWEPGMVAPVAVSVSGRGGLTMTAE